MISSEPRVLLECKLPRAEVYQAGILTLRGILVLATRQSEPEASTGCPEAGLSWLGRWRDPSQPVCATGGWSASGGCWEGLGRGLTLDTFNLEPPDSCVPLLAPVQFTGQRTQLAHNDS